MEIWWKKMEKRKSSSFVLLPLLFKPKHVFNIVPLAVAPFSSWLVCSSKTAHSHSHFMVKHKHKTKRKQSFHLNNNSKNEVFSIFEHIWNYSLCFEFAFIIVVSLYVNLLEESTFMWENVLVSSVGWIHFREAILNELRKTKKNRQIHISYEQNDWRWRKSILIGENYRYSFLAIFFNER